jgi:hypothetical protein
MAKDNWDRQLEFGLPDCRLSGSSRDKTVVVGRMEFERVFCANCGKSGGAVTAGWCSHIFYICDQCDEKLGPPPGCIEVAILG